MSPSNNKKRKVDKTAREILGVSVAYNLMKTNLKKKCSREKKLMRGRKQEKRSSLTSNVFSIISAIRNYAKDTEYDKKYDSAIFDKMINCVIMEYLVLWLDNDQQAKQGLVEFRKNKYKVIS